MKNTINIVLMWVTSLICIAGIVIGVAGDTHLRQKQLCPGINVCIPDSNINKFAKPEVIVKIIDSRYGGYINVPIYSINLCKMEKMLSSIDYVENATCYITRNGILNVEITQTRPVAKFISNGNLIYMSGRGKCMNAVSDWNSEIISLDGSPWLNNAKWMANLGTCCENLLKQESGFCKRVKTINCAGNGECTMLLNDRQEAFLLGWPENSAAKLKKVVNYEKIIAPARAMDTKKELYSIVDVRYKGQIICK